MLLLKSFEQNFILSNLSEKKISIYHVQLLMLEKKIIEKQNHINNLFYIHTILNISIDFKKKKIVKLRMDYKE